MVVYDVGELVQVNLEGGQKWNYKSACQNVLDDEDEDIITFRRSLCEAASHTDMRVCIR